MKKLSAIFCLLILMFMVGCAPAATSALPDASANDQDTSAAADTAEPVVDAPAWMSLPLVNARTGETFTLADFSGKTILVRGIAEWCTNCRRGQVAWRDEVLPQVDAGNVVFVSLDVETFNTAESLAAYADNYEYPWTFAVMTPEFQQAITEQFGNGVNSPPSEPQWMIRPNGSVVGLITDHSTPTLVSLLNSAAS